MKRAIRAFRERRRQLRHRMPGMRNDLEAKIDALAERLRIVFVLCALEGFSAAQAAAALGIAEAAVRARLARARSQLHEVPPHDAFAFDGERCDRVVARVLDKIASGTSPPGRASNARLFTTKGK
jgi:RNA polymerase sigma-70 factor (ECF subfamily)